MCLRHDLPSKYLKFYGTFENLSNLVKNRILLFDSIMDGHHPDYLIHLIGFFSGKKDIEICVVSGKAFKKQFDERQKLEGNAWGENIVFSPISNIELARIHSKSIYLRSFLEWNLMCEKAKEFKATQALLMYFDYFQLGIWMGKKSPCPISGIYFRPNFEVDDQRLYIRLKKWILNQALKTGKVQNLFCLVHALVPWIESLNSTANIIKLSDPIRNFAIHPQAFVDFKIKNQWPPNKTVFLNFGKQDDRKGIEVFLEACLYLSEVELSQICLVLAGPIDPSYRMQIDAKIAEMPGLAVLKLYGYLSAHEVQMAFEICDVVLILYQRFINMSSVLIRAAMAEKPTLSTETGVIGKLTKQLNLGEIVDATSAMEIAQGIRSFIEKKGIYSEDNMRQLAIENSVQSFVTTIEKALVKV